MHFFVLVPMPEADIYAWKVTKCEEKLKKYGHVCKYSLNDACGKHTKSRKITF